MMSSLRETIHLLAENGGMINLEELFKKESATGTKVSDLKATIEANVPVDLQIRMRGGTIIDSTATVISDDVKALPEPKEGES